MLILVVGAAALLVELQQSGNEAVRRNLIIQGKLAEVLAVVQGAETGQRGYLLTGDRQYLEPYEQAITRIGGTVAELESESSVAPYFHKQFGQLRVLVDEKLAEMRETIVRRMMLQNDECCYQQYRLS